ncbi:MAG: Ppx/GppA family phosphatase, partial [Rhodospirillaceae bacterium]|nr:Ppx/GppA family phosphatase [Rhodospirillaceae bacterium]
MAQPRTHSHSPSESTRDPHAYAAIDLGTNNCRLLVARINNGGFRVIDSFSRIVRLGEGL